MLFVLIPIAWLTIVAIVLAACRLSARADLHASGRELEPARDVGAPVISLPGLTVWDCGDPARLRRVAAALSARRPALSSRARRSNGHVVRGSPVRFVRRRGAPSAARS
jgi:hypothetical protein